MPKSAKQKSYSYENGHERKSSHRGAPNGKRVKPRRERQRKKPSKTLSAIDVFNLCKADPKALRAIANREYAYVDGRIILNSHSCLEVRNGQVHIKQSVLDSLERYTYGTSHSKNNKSPKPQRPRLLPWRMSAQKNSRGYRLRKSSANAFQIFAQTLEFKSLGLGGGSGPPDSFGEMLAWFMKHIEEKPITNAELAERLGVSDRTITRLRTGEKKPELNEIVALCVGLHLTYSCSERLINSAGRFLLKNDKLHCHYIVIISVCYNPDVTIDVCNSYLMANGFEPLLP